MAAPSPGTGALREDDNGLALDLVDHFADLRCVRRRNLGLVAWIGAHVLGGLAGVALAVATLWALATVGCLLSLWEKDAQNALHTLLSVWWLPVTGAAITLALVLALAALLHVARARLGAAATPRAAPVRPRAPRGPRLTRRQVAAIQRKRDRPWLASIVVLSALAGLAILWPLHGEPWNAAGLVPGIALAVAAVVLGVIALMCAVLFAHGGGGVMWTFIGIVEKPFSRAPPKPEAEAEAEAQAEATTRVPDRRASPSASLLALLFADHLFADRDTSGLRLRPPLSATTDVGVDQLVPTLLAIAAWRLDRLGIVTMASGHRRHRLRRRATLNFARRSSEPRAGIEAVVSSAPVTELDVFADEDLTRIAGALGDLRGVLGASSGGVVEDPDLKLVDVVLEEARQLHLVRDDDELRPHWRHERIALLRPAFEVIAQDWERFAERDAAVHRLLESESRSAIRSIAGEEMPEQELKDLVLAVVEPKLRRSDWRDRHWPA